jgi:hypothetical protein
MNAEPRVASTGVLQERQFGRRLDCPAISVARREVATRRCGRSSRRATVDALSRHALANLGHEWTGLRLEVFDDLITARKPA